MADGTRGFRLTPHDGSFEAVHAFECPRCGSQFASGSPYAVVSPPSCSAGHERVEMEQVMPSRFGAAHGTEGSNG